MQLHIIVTGRVQGVGFRFFVQRKANKFGLTGWVRNTSDGKVEAVLEGEKNELEEMVWAIENEAPGEVEKISKEIKEIMKEK